MSHCSHCGDNYEGRHACYVLAKVDTQEYLAPVVASDYIACRTPLSDADWHAGHVGEITE